MIRTRLYNTKNKIIRNLELFYQHRTLHPIGSNIYKISGVKLALNLVEPWHRIIYYQRYFEPELTTILLGVLRPNDIFVDIGANFGWYTLTAAVKCKELRAIYSFEPSANIYKLLMDGIKANDCDSLCHAQRVALSNQAGLAKLKTFNGLDPMHASLYPLADYSYEEESIVLDTLDSQVEKLLTTVSVIKCDVEGEEKNIMLGSHRTMRGDFGPPPMWFLEANYETAGMAGFFPWELVEIAVKYSYQGFCIRNGLIKPLAGRTALRHGDTLILAIPQLHKERMATFLK